MPLVVNSNIASLNAQRQLNSSGLELDQASERLASGRRINSAADDAAGLAISNRQTSQIRGLDQAIRNANDGISLIQTAEGALDESTNILQRIRELAVQSSNGIYSDTDRATLDAEVQQLVSELDRIAETTSFNGQNILDGSLGDVDLQVGSEANQTISFSIGAIDTANLGLGSTTSDLSGDSAGGAGAGAITLGEGDILINGQAVGSYTSTGDNENLQTLIDDINTNVTGVTASAFNIASGTSVATGVKSAGDALTIEVHSVEGGATTSFNLASITSTSVDDLVTQINDATGSLVTASVGDDGLLSLSNTNGATITVTAAATTLTATGFAAGPTDFFGSLALSADDGGPVTVSTGANGTAAQLASLGFNSIDGVGEVTGAALAAANQNGALVVGDVKINGTDIGAVAANAGLQAKVDAINAVTDETGVTATTLARESYTTNTGTGATYQEIIATGTIALANADTLDVNGVQITFDTGTGTAVLTAAEIAEEFNQNTANTGVTAYVDDAGAIHLASQNTITLGNGTAAGTVAELGATSITDLGGTAVTAGTAAVADVLAGEAGSVNLNGQEVSLTDIGVLDTLVTDINAATATTGVTAAIDDNGNLQLSSSSTINIALGDTQGFASLHALGITLTDANTNDIYTDDAVTINPRINLDSANDSSISVEVTTNGAADTGLKNLNTDLSSTVTGSAISSISVATVTSAQSAIGSIDQALETINGTRSQLGAVNNRLDFTVSNLANVSENTSAARSRIVDADFAAETAQLSRAQVLQQASQAILAQANARPQQVLSLLQ